MSLCEGVASAALIVGTLFYCAGTVGLLRFPDLFCRLHALTKADNVGLGFMVVGLALVADSWWDAVATLFIWPIVMIAGASSAHAVARLALRSGVEPWREVTDD